VVDKLTSSSYVDEYQFGFKAKHNTRLCTNVLKRGSYVFCSFVDFSKAFDRINYWKLFNKLLDDNIAYDVVKLLSLWYSNQSVSVRWQNTQSHLAFKIVLDKALFHHPFFHTLHS